MRIEFSATAASVPDERIMLNIAHANSLGLPFVARRAGGRALNVIGRGPSVTRNIEEIKGGDADNWAAGTGWMWCRDNGIDALLIGVDAHPLMAEYVNGCKSAILHPQCDPSVFAALGDADVKLVAPELQDCGSTAAMVAVALGAEFGTETRLYGCEGSYEESTHAGEDVPQPYEMTVRANGRVFRTNPQMMIQSEQLSEIVRMSAPGSFLDRSGGLLAALIASGGEWELLSYRNAPPHIAEMLERQNVGNPGWGDDGAADWAARAAQ